MDNNMQQTVVRILLLSFIACFLSNGAAQAQSRPVPCTPVLTKAANLSPGAKHEAAFDAVQKENPLSLYSIGEPSAEETYVLELINRARANPPAEGLRLDTTTDPDISAAYTYWGTPTRAE